MDPLAAAMTASAVTAALVIATGLAYMAARSKRRPIEFSSRVLVALTSGETVEGVLVEKRADGLVLRDVTIHAGGGHSSVDGAVVLDRDRITWVQVP